MPGREKGLFLSMSSLKTGIHGSETSDRAIMLHQKGRNGAMRH